MESSSIFPLMSDIISFYIMLLKQRFIHVIGCCRISLLLKGESCFIEFLYHLQPMDCFQLLASINDAKNMAGKILLWATTFNSLSIYLKKLCWIPIWSCNSPSAPEQHLHISVTPASFYNHQYSSGLISLLPH